MEKPLRLSWSPSGILFPVLRASDLVTENICAYMVIRAIKYEKHVLPIKPFNKRTMMIATTSNVILREADPWIQGGKEEK